MTEIAISVITPVMLAIITIIGKVYLAKISKNNEKIINYFEINKQNSEFIQKMNQIKIHYIAQYTSKNWKNAACEKAEKFISVISHILDNYTIDIQHWECIKNELDSGSAYVRNRLIEYIGESATNKFYKQHCNNYRQYLITVEDILADTENHYKERFIKASTEFLKLFLKEMKK